MGHMDSGHVFKMTNEHLNREVNGTRIHPLRAALYDETGGEIELTTDLDGCVRQIHINDVMYIVCERIQNWCRAYKALDGRVSPIDMELIISEDGEMILHMNYDKHLE